MKRLGAGAMGVVYLCQDPLLKRKVAVKTVKEGANSDAILARFQRESEISAQLNHPNIITVFDVGNDEKVGPFLTMELVEGCSLASMVEKGPMDPKIAIQLLAQGAQALVAAERGGVVHRDVKAENILVSHDGRLKLTDFGVARDESSTMTTTGVVMGTPTHTAPELLAGNIANPGTDRYAFGVMAYQMMTGGLLPHPGETISAVLTHIVNELPVIPEDMPPPAARTFLKALHKDPERRFESLLAFLESLADSYGVRDALSTAGLSPTATPLPSDSGTREIRKETIADARTSTTGGTRKSQGDIQSQIPSNVAKLSGPPSDLLRAGKEEVDPEEETGPRPAKNIGLLEERGPQFPPRGDATRRIQSSKSAQHGENHLNLVIILLIIVAGLVGWNWYRAQPSQAPTAQMYVDVITEPKGAKVFVDDEFIDQAPLFTKPFAAKDHTIYITMDGYKPYRGTFGPRKALPDQIRLEREGAP
ncbi:MAG TPA: serine/threonine-protein kinase [Holophagaceae bacterium]|nr:serine/threonine-protein kinase [Holophagaceae bacterium]